MNACFLSDISSWVPNLVMILMRSLKMQSWFGRTHLPTVSPTDSAEGFFLVLVPVTADKTEKVI